MDGYRYKIICHNSRKCISRAAFQRAAKILQQNIPQPLCSAIHMYVQCAARFDIEVQRTVFGSTENDDEAERDSQQS